MEKLDSIFENALKAGKKLEIRITEKALEMSVAEEAVKTAAADMERAAIQGNESAYAQAKEKRNEAENRLEILRIREKNNVEKTDWIKEAAPILQDLEKNSVSEIRKMCVEFLTKYDDLVKLVEKIDSYSIRYNNVQDYYRNHVFRSNDYRSKRMAELLPIMHILDFKKKFNYQRGMIENSVGK